MNKLKLLSHQKNYREEDLLVNVKDLGTDVREGDVVEIYHPEDDQPRLLLQIPLSKDDITVQKDTISVEQSIAQTFQLRSYKDVIVRKLHPKDVSLEMVEITFKDQYLGRSDMWRLKKSLVNSVLYLNKKIEFCNGSIRCQVYDMWAQGEKMACGMVTDNTKIVYRSSTSMVYLFIQMSSEMWEFDIYGDLYFERAVNGFLTELFAKWKKEGSNHEVTIVLFSRTYYQATTIEEFPHHMRECICQDYKGTFYEDFYRVVVQNEQYEDWTPILAHLRQVFHRYQSMVLDHHHQEGIHTPKGINSPASQGNFLEVLNISLNVFEKHYLERTFDRTGQVSVVITPGVGVFEVDRELTNITKQRIIDYGVGTDLVCVGEQPLHAVPLLKFHNKRGSLNADDYSMPHTWINLSFYSTNKKIGYGSFVPRIKLPMEIENIVITKKKTDILGQPRMKAPQEETTLPNSIFDYDAYDAQVFKLPNNQNNKNFRSLHRTTGRKKTQSTCQASSVQTTPRVYLKREMSDPDIYHSIDQMYGSYTTMGSSISSLNDKSPAINIPARIPESKTYSRSFGALNVEAGRSRPCGATLYEGEELSPPMGATISGGSLTTHKIGSSAGTSPTDHPQQASLGRNAGRPGRSLINPFDPSHVTIKLTSNRRRWIHIFPKDNQGLLIQQHHYKDTSQPTSTAAGAAIDSEVLGLNNSHVLECGSQDSLGIGAEQQQQQQQQGGSTSSSVGGPKMLDTPSAIPPRLFNNTLNDDVLFRNTSTPQKSVSACSTLTRTPGSSQKISSEKRLLWGATGEQEWTAAMTTGVDWKSLTLPACLPITTDYFPDDRGLKNDYMVKEYSLLPEDMNELCRLGSKKQLTAAVVFRELVSQRLAQGFQLILFDESEKADLLNSSLQIGNSPSSFSLMRQRSKNKESSEEIRLSIGRIFHKIRLKGSTIDVTIYTPRHPYPLLKRQYRYRFQAPDMDSYEISWVEFRTERLETYKWNLVDNYIVFCGESPDYQLTEALKFWRFRVLVVSQEGFRWTTKSIIDSTFETPCDIYNPLTIEEQQTTIEGFLRFLELTVHRLRRPVNARKTKINMELAHKSAAGFRERLGSNRVLERPPRPRAGSKASDRMRYESGNRESHIDQAEMKSLIEPEEEAAEENEISKKVTVESALSEIVELMRDSVNGVGFLNRQPGLPTLLFLSADATAWICDNVEGANTEIIAVTLLQSMVEQGLICHASGDQKHPFYHGFFLYFIVTGNKDQDTVSRDPDTYKSEWHEVEISPLNYKPGSGSSSSSNSTAGRQPACPVFLDSDLPPHPTWNAHSLYKIGALDIDINQKSDRLEWGHLKYHSIFSPLQAYEIILEWVCGTGNIVMELLLTWQRKAQTCGLHLFPVPSDPFALPNSFNSDPLRGPILISLNIGCLSDKGSTEPFEQFSSSSRPRRMHLFQESILKRFGFVPYVKELNGGDYYQFVHVSGNMFVMIHSPGSGGSVAPLIVYNDSITRKRTLSDSSTPVPGFLWTFNYMLTKRWKSSISGDNEVGFSMLHDFRQFCSNHNNRLRDFWDSFLPERTLSQDEPTDM